MKPPSSQPQRVAWYRVPVVWLGMKQSSVPVPQFLYGYKLEQVTAKEKQIIADGGEERPPLAVG